MDGQVASKHVNIQLASDCTITQAETARQTATHTGWQKKRRLQIKTNPPTKLFIG